MGSEVGMIVACDLNGIIGHKNTIPWHNKTDLKRFRSLTKGCPLIMGRKTWESLPVSKKHGVKLPGRPKYVLSRTVNGENTGNFVKETTWCSGLLDAVTLAKQNHPDENIWIIGGSNIYNQAVYASIPDFIDLTVLNFKWYDDDMDFGTITSIAPIPYSYMVASEVQNEDDPLLFHRRYVKRPLTPNV